MNRRLLAIGILAFLLCAFFLGFRWYEFGLTDSLVWAHEAQYLIDGDARAYDLALAYGQGAPLVAGTLALTLLTGLSAESSVFVFTGFLASLFFAFSIVLAYLISGSRWWPAVLPAVLGLNWLHTYDTPPILMAYSLSVFLALLTLFPIKKAQSTSPGMLIAWGIAAGLLFSTRVDAGILIVLPLGFLLVEKNARRFLTIALPAAFGAFALSDPFIWLAPLRHIHDLWAKMFYHYSGEFAVIKLPIPHFLAIFSLALLSMALWWLIQKRYSSTSPLPSSFLLTTTALTGVALTVFLTSDMQVGRYLLPEVFIWETLLPAAVFWLLEKDGIVYRHPRVPWLIVGLFYLCPLSFLAFDVLLYRAYGLLR